MTENGNDHSGLQITIERFGPGPEVTDAVRKTVSDHPSVQEYLGQARSRVLSVELLNPTLRGKPDGPMPPDHYRATIYDYTNNRVVLATGRLDDIQGSMELSEAGYQPLPNREEFDEAVEILLEDDDLGPAIREQSIVPYRPMPPLIESELPDGRVERTLGVGLLPQERGARHEIVGANMVHRTAARFQDRAPEGALAAAATCGLPNAHQAPTPKGVAGQFRVTIPRADGSPLWSFLLIRPSASSGTNASGVELQNVMYRGKLVLFQAHAPILNVRYDRDACGPFRDWLFEESWVQADGTNVAPGIRRSQTPAQTILESGSDSGNFRGVAVYRQDKRPLSLASCRRVGTGTSASGASTTTGPSGRASGSRPWKTRASATSTTTMSTGGSTSTSAPGRTTWFASSTPRPSSPRTTGTPTGSRPRVAEGRTSAEGGRSGTRRPATPTT